MPKSLAASAERREPTHISRAPRLLPSSGLPPRDLVSSVAPSVPPPSASAQPASSASARPSPPPGSPLGWSAPRSRTRRHAGAHAQILAPAGCCPPPPLGFGWTGSHAQLPAATRRRGPAQVRQNHVRPPEPNLRRPAPQDLHRRTNPERHNNVPPPGQGRVMHVVHHVAPSAREVLRGRDQATERGVFGPLGARIDNRLNLDNLPFDPIRKLWKLLDG